MKMHLKVTIIALALAGSAVCLVAQDNGNNDNNNNNQRPRRQGNQERTNGQRPPMPPLIAALDANHDGVIDATEIDNAPAALRKLDKNNDGKLTRDELRPPRPEGVSGPEGPRGLRNGQHRFGPGGRPPFGNDGQDGPPAEADAPQN